MSNLFYKHSVLRKLPMERRVIIEKGKIATV